ncbi:polysaccharide deacetylase family protein [Paractinoplanes deccanensis]|uniref:polysaccharide deacetylase family protein n=1 Tax=Paractinoplanes deccanensis TaxID=113561 RepID=UPI001EF39E38|nr:polysaccharide deacetylase family protein [Actinoplanes deccanensis]
MATSALLAVAAGCSAAGGSSSAPASPSPSYEAPPVTTPSTAAPATDTRQAALAALPPALRNRIPQFPPAPAPTKVTLPAGNAAGWFSRVPTDQKIAFITIDDGWVKHPQALRLLQAANVPTTLFLEVNAIKDNPAYFKALESAGATIEDHTISHPNLKGKSYAFQKSEICGGADRLAAYYGRRPVLFRPPGGTHDATTLRVVKDCGMKAAFYWKETTDHGVVFYQEGKTVKPGDIILMHFRPRFPDDFLAVLNAIHKAGLTPARLEDYIP